MRTAISPGQWQPWTAVSPLLGLIRRAIAVGSMNVENPHVSKTLYCRGEWKHSFKRQARSLSRVGWFSRALAFRSLDYPWAKMGSICSLPLTRQIRSQVMVLSYQSTFTSPEPPVHLAGEAWSSLTWDQASIFFFFFTSLAREGKKITPDTFI